MSEVKGIQFSDWELIIGLEVHCQVISNTKLFSNASTQFGCSPNDNVDLLDMGLPGVLPRLNAYCVQQALKTSLALQGTINKISYFDRKHYFYPDLPLGYQITQFYQPIMQNGKLEIDVVVGGQLVQKTIDIERLHIEQDAGKLIHDYHPSKSLIDLNRAGIALMEIVSGPDLRSKEEVASYVNTLRLLLRTIGTCDGNMDQGSLRCDVNISVRKLGEAYRNRVEVKNVNSVKFMQQAIDYEMQRQIEVWEQGGVVTQETRLFNADTGETFPLRSKEDTADYRYMRDPDLLPLVISNEWIVDIADTMPELPSHTKKRLINEYELTEYDANLMISDVEYTKYFFAVLNADNPHNIQRSAKLVANWMLTNLVALLKKEQLSIVESKIPALALANMLDLLILEKISSKVAKELFELMWNNPQQTPLELISIHGLDQTVDVSKLENLIATLCQNNQDQVQQIKQGKDKLLGWFVGQVMKETQGKADPKIVNKLLNEQINKF